MRTGLCRIKLAWSNFPGLHFRTASIQQHKTLDPIPQTENATITVRERPSGRGGAITLNSEPAGFRKDANPHADLLRRCAGAYAGNERHEAEQDDKLPIE
jgi:hypothetical protein